MQAQEGIKEESCVYLSMVSKELNKNSDTILT
jgi:hypothetical protein